MQLFILLWTWIKLLIALFFLLFLAFTATEVSCNSSEMLWEGCRTICASGYSCYKTSDSRYQNCSTVNSYADYIDYLDDEYHHCSAGIYSLCL